VTARVPVYGHLKDLDEREARRRIKRMYTGNIKLPPVLRKKDDETIGRELGGLFIDRLYESGEDLISEGARILGMSGDDEG
jgi:hypothetical protein